MIIIYQCKVFNCNKSTALVGEVGDEGGCACVEMGSVLSFPVNLKLLLKSKSLIKNINWCHVFLFAKSSSGTRQGTFNNV